MRGQASGMTIKDFLTPLFYDFILIIFVGRLGLFNRFQWKKQEEKRKKVNGLGVGIRGKRKNNRIASLKNPPRNDRPCF